MNICGGEIMEGWRKSESDFVEGDCWVWLLENWGCLIQCLLTGYATAIAIGTARLRRAVIAEGGGERIQ